MKGNSKLCICVLLHLFLATNSFSQSGTSSTGGDALGAGGSASFTVGQVFTNLISGVNASLAEGVQQPYEISILSGLKDQDINLRCIVFPNPSSSLLELKIDIQEGQKFQYEIYNVEGILLIANYISENLTSISIKNFASGTYLLELKKDYLVLKSYQIVKY